MSAHSLEGQLHPELHQKKRVCQVKGGDSHEDRVEVRVSTQEWCGPVRGSSEKGYKGDGRNGAALLQKEVERHRVVQHGEEVVYGDIIETFQNLKGHTWKMERHHLKPRVVTGQEEIALNWDSV